MLIFNLQLSKPFSDKVLIGLWASSGTKQGFDH